MGVDDKQCEQKGERSGVTLGDCPDANELVNLWPRVAEGGVLIIHDYGAWRAPKAVDEYFAQRTPRPPT